MAGMTDRLMLLDTAGIYFRAFYGVPDTVTAPDGTVVNAVRGTIDIIARLVSQFQPTHLIACWDDDWRPQWRVDLIPTYKTHRVAEVIEVGPDVEVIPDPLTVQVPLIAESLRLLGIPIIGAAEHEADDVIGTLASTATMPVDVVTGDRDLFQLVDDARDVRVIYTGRGMANLEILDGAAIEAKYAITAAAVRRLRGDARRRLRRASRGRRCRREDRREAAARVRRPRRDHRRGGGSGRPRSHRACARSCSRHPTTSRSRRPSSTSCATSICPPSTRASTRSRRSRSMRRTTSRRAGGSTRR